MWNFAGDILRGIHSMETTCPIHPKIFSHPGSGIQHGYVMNRHGNGASITARWVTTRTNGAWLCEATAPSS